MCKKRWIVQKEDKVKKKEDKQQTIPQIIEEVIGVYGKVIEDLTGILEGEEE